VGIHSILYPNVKVIFKGDRMMKDKFMDKLLDLIIGTVMITMMMGSLMILANIVY
jgi:uncharacterized membrane protein